MTDSWSSTFTVYVKRGKLQDAVQLYENHDFELSDSIGLELIRALRDKKSSPLLVRFFNLLENPTPVICSYLFITALETYDFQTAFTCINKCEDNARVVDFLRLFIITAINKKQLPQIFKFNYNAKLPILMNELLCYSIRTIPVGAMFYYYIGDVHGTLSALYLYGRTLLRTISKENLQKAASAFILYLSISKRGQESCVRSVADQSLVSRKSIEKLLRRIEILVTFADPAVKFTWPDFDILKFLYDVENFDEIAKFAKICPVNELSKFCIYLINQQTIADHCIEMILGVDKRKWNWKLHEDVLHEFLRQNLVPPVWFIDAMMHHSRPTLIAMANRYARIDILEEVFCEIDEKNEKVSKYLVPLLNQTLKVPNLALKVQEIIKTLIEA